MLTALWKYKWTVVTALIIMLMIFIFKWLRQRMENPLQHPNVKAFLKTIRFAEGTAGPDGYRMMFTGILFNDFSDHPRKVICATLGGKQLCSSAAGAYQFLRSTWDRLAKKLNLPDFSPESQDKAAVELIREQGALEDVKAGRFERAIDKVQDIWASLPDVPGNEPPAGYGQPIKTIGSLKTEFQKYGGIAA